MRISVLLSKSLTIVAEVQENKPIFLGNSLFGSEISWVDKKSVCGRVWSGIGWNKWWHGNITCKKVYRIYLNYISPSLKFYLSPHVLLNALNLHFSATRVFNSAMKSPPFHISIPWWIQAFNNQIYLKF